MWPNLSQNQAQNINNFYYMFSAAQALPTMTQQYTQSSAMPFYNFLYPQQTYQQYPTTTSSSSSLSGLYNNTGSIYGNMYNNGGMLGNLMSYIKGLTNFLTNGSSLPSLNSKSNNSNVVIEDEIQGAWGDPHFGFKDKSGEKTVIDHKGVDGKTYNILNADGLDIDAEYAKTNDANAPQVMGAVRINAGGQELLMNKGKVTLDGKEIKAGEEKRLADGRTFTVQENGTVKFNTKDEKGSITVLNQGDHYDIDPTGQFNIDTSKNAGGILGYLTLQGQNKTREEILKKDDTNGNGMFDSGDKSMENVFKSNNDIGLYQY